MVSIVLFEVMDVHLMRISSHTLGASCNYWHHIMLMGKSLNLFSYHFLQSDESEMG